MFQDCLLSVSFSNPSSGFVAILTNRHLEPNESTPAPAPAMPFEWTRSLPRSLTHSPSPSVLRPPSFVLHSTPAGSHVEGRTTFSISAYCFEVGPRCASGRKRRRARIYHVCVQCNGIKRSNQPFFITLRISPRQASRIRCGGRYIDRVERDEVAREIDHFSA